VPGWTEALQLMRPGDVWEVWLPAKLAYGDQDKGDIPPNSVLDFKIELLDVFPHPG
jgi:peptidylprolyl isomerase/FKBP-type peptidyl-prolyl cis-trans isomerase FklB